VAWIVTAAGERRVEGKPAIAFAIADALEALLAPQAEVDGSTPADDRA